MIKLTQPSKKKSKKNNSSMLICIIVGVLISAFVFNNFNKLNHDLGEDSLRLQIDDARYILTELKSQSPAPKIHSSWKKMDAVAKYYGLKVKILSNEEAGQAKMYQGPLAGWHARVSGPIPNVLAFMNKVNTEIPIYSYYYTVQEEKMDTMLSVVGNI